MHALLKVRSPINFLIGSRNRFPATSTVYVSGGIHADEGSAAPEKPSPWLMVPLLTSNPKYGYFCWGCRRIPISV